MATPQKMSLAISQATPMRERTHATRLEPTSQYSSPTSVRGTSSTIAASNHSPSTSSPSAPINPLTIDSVMATHASAADPPLAALESLVADRNTLAAQNAQLWKLIEKQRTGYSQLMKELERVRGERDVFRSKLHGLGQNTDALLKAHREKEKREGKESLRSTASHTHLRGNDSGGSLSSNHGHEVRGHTTRAQSDDNSLRPGPRSANLPSRDSGASDGRERQDSQTSLETPSSSSQISTAYLTAPHTSSTPNLTFSPTSSIPQSASSSTVSLSNGRQASEPARKPSPLHLGSTRSDSLPPGTDVVPSVGAQSAKADTSSTSHNDEDPILGSWNGPHSSRSPQAPRNLHPPAGITVTSPSGLNGSSVSPDSLHPKRDFPQESLSLAVAKPQFLSRESRVSIPEEAKRYYASMSESGISSPRSLQPSSPASHSPGAGSNTPSLSESPPLILSGSDSQHQDDTSQFGQPEAEDGEEFLELEDGDSTYESTTGEGAECSRDPENGDEDSRVKEYDGGTNRTAVEDFPLPPSSPPIHPTGDTFSQSQTQSMHRLQGDRGFDDAQSQYSVTTAFTSESQTLVETHSSQRRDTSSASPLAPLNLDSRLRQHAPLLLPSDLTTTQIIVSHSSIRPNDRGKEVLSFAISVQPAGKDPWKIEKLFSDVLTLDSRVRSTLGKSLAKKLVTIPEGRLWKDHAPAKVDQRKVALEAYFRSLLSLPIGNKEEILGFFTSDVTRETQKPVSQAGYKEGYLTKRGKNFGGWKTRFFVLQGPSLEYYESRGGAHLGSITITGAQIGRQQKTQDKQQLDEENEYRHAFLIIEAKRVPGGSNPRHVLCAQSDRERDDWVEELVRYVTGTYNDEEGSLQDDVTLQNVASRNSSSSDPPVTPNRRPRKDDIAISHVVPISQLALDPKNAKLFQTAPPPPADLTANVGHSPVKPTASQSYPDPRSASGGLETPLSTSLPSASPLTGVDDADAFVPANQRANSEMGHYPDLVDQRAEFTKGRLGRSSPEHGRKREKRRSLNPLRSAPIPEREPSPEKDGDPHTPRVDAHGKVKISGPMNGTPIPAGYKFGGKDAIPEPPTNERREKAKSRMFWGFGRQHDKANASVHVSRAVFGVPLEESLDVAQIAGLPAIVFRCIQYLEAKKAEQEEGIYRLSGSSAVIKSLKDRFNTEGDVDLLASDEYWDPHAISGLLKTFLRDLPASILTRDLHLRFLSVIDFIDSQERIAELSHLIASLPVANYSLLRALTAHLILIVQNANTNKMTMRNVGIVFSPTLGIPAGVFSLMLGEFKRVFNVDGSLDDGEPDDAESDTAADLSRRNSQHYSDAAADKMLGLSGRTLSAPADDGQSDEGEELSLHYDSGTEDTNENDATVDSSGIPKSSYLHAPDATSNSVRSHASSVAASRGLNIAVADKANRRQSRVIGLPHSPRPHPSNTVPAASPHTPNVPKAGSTPHTPATPGSPRTDPNP